MNINDLDTLTFRNIGEEVSAENRDELSPIFLNAYNEAYFSLCASTIKPTAGDMVSLDEEKRFTPDKLEKHLVPGGIVAVKKCKDYTGDSSYTSAPEYDFHWTEDDSIAVPGAEEGAEVYVVYRHFPKVLTNDPADETGDFTPSKLPEQYHAALASYAASAFFRVRRKFERMQVWMETYLAAVRDLQGRADSSTPMLKNVFTPMP